MMREHHVLYFLFDKYNTEISTSIIPTILCIYIDRSLIRRVGLVLSSGY